MQKEFNTMVQLVQKEFITLPEQERIVICSDFGTGLTPYQSKLL